MLPPRWRKVLADLLSSKVRTLLVVLSIAVGVFAVGTAGGAYLVISRTVSIAYLAANPAQATISGDFDEAAVHVAQRFPGVKEAAGKNYQTVKVQLGPERWKDLNLYLLADFKDIRIAKLELLQGRYPTAGDEIAVEHTTLPLLQAQVGDQLTVKLYDGRLRQMKLVGVVYDATEGAATLTDYWVGYGSVKTLEWMGLERRFSEIGITVAKDSLNQAHIQEVADAAAHQLEKTWPMYGVYVATPGEHPASQIIQGILLVLSGLGIFSLFLSGFLVINTISGLLAQHIRQIGMMKAIGARTGQVVGMYLVLVSGFGLLAFALAAPLSALAAYALTKFVADSVNFDLSHFAMPPEIILVQALISLLVPILTSLVPVLSGARLTVRQAISDYGLGQQSEWREKKKRAAPGPTLNERLAQWLTQFFPRPLLISFRNTFRRKARLLLTLLTLTLAGAIFIAVFNVQYSLQSAVDDFLFSFLSDVNLFFEHNQRITEVEAVARDVPGIVGLEGWAMASLKLLNAQNEPTDDLTAIGAVRDSQMIHPIIDQGRWFLPGETRVMVPTVDLLIQHPEIKVGDTVNVELNGRKISVVIVGVMRALGNAGNAPIVYMPYDYLAPLTGMVGATSAFRLSTAQKDFAAQDRAAKLLKAALEERGMKVASYQTGSELQQQTSTLINIIIAFFVPMAILIGVVGALGLMGTMSLNVLERTREIGVMRSLGASNFRIFQMVIVEGMLIGGISWSLGLLMALPISDVLTKAISYVFARTYFATRLSLNGFLLWLAVVLALSALASLLPAWNAARLTVRETLAYE